MLYSKDERGRKTVVDLIDTKERIFPIGRLDYDTEGLLLLTNDGEIFNKVIHPRTEVYKTYLVEARGNINMTTLNKLKRGIMLDDKMTLPAKAKILLADERHTELHFAIKEGRNRQVRRMFEIVGHPVINLKRIMLGELNLDGLEVGEYRPLTKKRNKLSVLTLKITNKNILNIKINLRREVMALSKEEVLHVAKLARLEFSPEEIEKYQQELNDILNYIDMLNEVDAAEIKPLAQVNDDTNNLREDEVRKSLTVQEALLNAPEAEDGAVIVPKVVGGE